jgi:uncharacterized protein (TIGR02246 family)
MQLLTESSDIEMVMAELAEAWERGDADAYGALFTEDASYTTFAGTVYQGRHDIVESHRVLFAKFLKGTRLASGISSIRFLRDDVAIVTGSGDTYKKRPPKTPSKVQTLTLARRPGGRWLIAAFHNTRRKPLMESVMFRFAPQTRPATR